MTAHALQWLSAVQLTGVVWRREKAGRPTQWARPAVPWGSVRGALVRWWKMGLLGRWPAGAKVLEDDKARDVECGRWLVLLELQDKGKWWEERSGQNGSHVPGFEGPYAYHIFIQSEPGKGSERTTTNGQNNNIHLLSYLLYASSILSTFSNSSHVLTHLQ